MGQNNPKRKKGAKKQPPKALPFVRRLETAPAAKSRRLTEFRPIERAKSNGSREIIFKEYVQDIAGSAVFAVTQFQCNPGLSNLFAWLSLQALFYQEYTVKYMKFCFETEKATTLSGKVMFAFLQDSSDAAPASKQEMLENLMKASGAVWEPFCLPINLKNFPALGRSRFIRGGVLAANLDVKTYDIGQLVVATQGMADTSLVGELYVEYGLELRTPIQSVAQIAQQLSVHIVGQAVSAASTFGAAPTSSGGLNVTALTSTLTFNQAGQYLVEGDCTGTGLHTAFAPVTAGSSTTALFIGQNISNAAANAGTAACYSVLVTVSARGQVLVLDLSTQATTVTSSEVRISQYALANG